MSSTIPEFGYPMTSSHDVVPATERLQAGLATERLHWYDWLLGFLLYWALPAAATGLVLGVNLLGRLLGLW
jgi:hypothetical protein